MDWGALHRLSSANLHLRYVLGLCKVHHPSQCLSCRLSALWASLSALPEPLQCHCPQFLRDKSSRENAGNTDRTQNKDFPLHQYMREPSKEQGNKESVISLFPLCLLLFLYLLIMLIKYLLCCAFMTLSIFQNCAIRQNHNDCEWDSVEVI
jgi:hypothetical protein